MKEVTINTTKFEAEDGTRFDEQNNCLAYEAQSHRAYAREKFVEARSKTPRSALRLRNMLLAYDAFCATGTAPPDEEEDEDEETGEVALAVEV